MPLPIAKMAAAAVLTIANLGLQMRRKIEGPRLDDVKVTGADYGTPLYMVWALRRLEVPIFWAEEMREVKRRRKTKGGKYNDYTYFGTWAVALAGHQIDAVRRIWFDTHLVFDLSGAGPVTPFDFGGFVNVDDHVSIYLGTETQDPDPRMEATVEAEFGEGSCPAYRGTPYIVFKDIPLAKVGNRVPQVSVEVVGAAETTFPFATLAALPNAVEWASFSPDYSMLAVANGSNFGVVDVASRTVMGYQDWQQTPSVSTNSVAMDETGRFFTNNGSDVYLESFEGGVPDLLISLAGDAFTFFYFVDGNGNDHWFARSGSSPNDFYFNGIGYDIGVTSQSVFPFAGADGESIWLVGRDTADANNAIFRQIHGSGAASITATLPTTSSFTHAFDAGDHWVLGWDGDLYAIDKTDGSILFSNTSLAEPSGIWTSGFHAIPPRASTFWISFEEINSSDLSSVRVYEFFDWVGGSSTEAQTIYDPVNHALITRFAPDLTLYWCFLDRIGSSGVDLGTICSDVAEWVGVEDHDFADLDQTVEGWSATRGPASAMLEPLLDAYDADIRPHDFEIEGVKRHGVSSGSTLLTERFVGDPRYTVKVRQGAELPRAMIYDFADTDAEQQPNSVRSDRPLDATGARGEKKIDLTTLALDVDEARGLADRHFRRIWNERKEISNALTAQNLALEPGDVRTLSLDGETITARCVRLTVQADDVLSCEWRYDHASLALLDGAAGAAFDGRDEQTVTVAVLSKGVVLDIPLISDADDATPPQVYPLAGAYVDGAWPGAVTYQAIDGEYSDELAAIASSSQSTWGHVTEALPYANPNVWDRGSEITVTLKTGELTGCTEAAADANPALNLCVIGANGRWEMVQFTVATLTAPLTYTVSGFKRGRRGTEWAAELHEAGDEFWLLENADPVAMGLDEVGTDVGFKTITAGRTSGFPYEYEYQGQSLMPYAPCQLEAVKEASGDWTISWVRRTRLGGAWTGGSSIPLGEASEEYEVDILDGVAVERTFTAADIAENGDGGSVTYTLAQQTTDFGGEVLAGDLDFKVYQISATVDRGFAAVGAA